jgi:hypothetical protein
MYSYLKDGDSLEVLSHFRHIFNQSLVARFIDVPVSHLALLGSGGRVIDG